MLEYFERIDNLASECRKISNVQACSDLLKMCDAAHSIGTDLSRELVECRRRHKLSARSQTLIEELDEAIATVEKMLIYAKLMYPTR